MQFCLKELELIFIVGISKPCMCCLNKARLQLRYDASILMLQWFTVEAVNVKLTNLHSVLTLHLPGTNSALIVRINPIVNDGHEKYYQ